MRSLFLAYLLCLPRFKVLALIPPGTCELSAAYQLRITLPILAPFEEEISIGFIMVDQHQRNDLFDLQVLI